MRGRIIAISTTVAVVTAIVVTVVAVMNIDKVYNIRHWTANPDAIASAIYVAQGESHIEVTHDQAVVITGTGSAHDCDFLQEGDQKSFQNQINANLPWTGENWSSQPVVWPEHPVDRRVAATAGLLYYCTSTQDQKTARDWGLTDADFEKFDVK